MVQGNQDVGVMLATLWCHWKCLSVLPLLVGVMYLFGHQVTGDLRGHYIEEGIVGHVYSLPYPVEMFFSHSCFHVDGVSHGKSLYGGFHLPKTGKDLLKVLDQICDPKSNQIVTEN